MKMAKKDIPTLELKVPIFVNSRNGQRSIILPKKKYEKFMKDCPPGEKVKISLWKNVR